MRNTSNQGEKESNSLSVMRRDLLMSVARISTYTDGPCSEVKRDMSTLKENNGAKFLEGSLEELIHRLERLTSNRKSAELMSVPPKSSQYIISVAHVFKQNSKRGRNPAFTGVDMTYLSQRESSCQGFICG